MRKIVWLFIFFLPLTSFSTTIYMQEKDNNITYSDTPISNAKKIEVPNNNVVQTKPIITQTTASTVPTALTPASYKTFEIISPKDQETFQNLREIPVEVKIDPQLIEGDKVSLYVDGTPNGAPQASTRLMLQNIERGLHQIYATLVDKNNNILLKSKPVVIYIHYPSAVNPPPRTGG